jgi:hypothetical protein
MAATERGEVDPLQRERQGVQVGKCGVHGSFSK